MLLDSFGTLVLMEPPGPHLRAALARAGVHVSERRADEAFRAEIRYYLAHHVEGRDAASLSALRDRCAAVLHGALGEAGLDVEAARAAMLDSIRFKPFPDVVPALRDLRDRGLKLVVASNWDCSLPEVLERAGLAALVDGVVASAAVGADKPAPAVFRAALRLAGCGADRAVHVGDSPSADVAGAEAAGIRAVLIDREGGAGPPAGAGTRIASLAELPRVI